MRTLITLLSGLALLASATPVRCEQFVDAGAYRIHYQALPTSVLAPEVASAYAIRRSDGLAMLNITVLRRGSAGELDTPVKATVTASARNLTGQKRVVEMREIEDQGGIYYIGVTRVANEETLRFTVLVTPPGAGEPHELVFSKKFYVDG